MISLFHDNFEFTGTYYIPAPRIQIMQQLEDVVRYELYASRFEPTILKSFRGEFQNCRVDRSNRILGP